MGRTIFDNSDPAQDDESFEEAAALLGDEESELERDLATEELYDTQHGDGHTYNPQQAWEQGLTYTPPHDPATQPSDDLQDAEFAAGFGTSVEDSGADEEVLPSNVDNNDDELQNDVYLILRNNSETADLTDITVRVRDGVVTLLGTVPTDTDIALVDEIVWDIDGVLEVENQLDIDI
jgi:hypothetical protein